MSDAALRLHARRAARSGLEAFSRFTYSKYQPAPHAKRLCDAIDPLLYGGSRRVLIEMPPRHGKSFHVSERLPALFLGRNPDQHIIITSHSDKMSRRFGRRVRKLVNSPEFRELFPDVTMNRRVDANDEFETEQGGLYIATGINGNYMGAGAHLLGIDDPYKSRADAESPAVRASVLESFIDLETRLEPGASLYVLHTRWHEDDLIGWIKKTRVETGKEEWDCVTMPLISGECEQWEKVESGEASDAEVLQYQEEAALWPDRWPIEACRKIRRRTPRRTWVSLYQQKPGAKEGDRYKKSWFHRFRLGTQPKGMHRYVVSDFAVTKDDGDFTEFYGFGADEFNNIWFEDCWYGQAASNEWVESLVFFLKRYKPLTFTGESGQIRRAIEPFLVGALERESVYVNIEWLAPVGDKVARSRGSCGMASMGKFYIPETDWGDRLVQQLVEFPTSNMDHSVDAVSQIGRLMDMYGSTMKPVVEEPLRLPPPTAKYDNVHYVDFSSVPDRWKVC